VSSVIAAIFQQQNVCCNSYYDGDQERLFSEAHVVNPFRTIPEHAQGAQVVVISSVNLCVW